MVVTIEGMKLRFKVCWGSQRVGSGLQVRMFRFCNGLWWWWKKVLGSGQM